MGEYFSLYNHTKKEKVVMWKLGGLAKWDEINWNDPDLKEFLMSKVERPSWHPCGRWEGDEVEFIGDYDYRHSKVESYTDISDEIREEYFELLRLTGRGRWIEMRRKHVEKMKAASNLFIKGGSK